MDVTQSLASSVNALSAQVPAFIQKLTDAGAADEANALASLHADLVEALKAESDLIDKILAGAGALLLQAREMFDGAEIDIIAGGFKLKLAPPKEN